MGRIKREREREREKEREREREREREKVSLRVSLKKIHRAASPCLQTSHISVLFLPGAMASPSAM